MATKLFERSKSMKISLDDTTPLMCVVESGEKVQDHVVSSSLFAVILSDIQWLWGVQWPDCSALY